MASPHSDLSGIRVSIAFVFACDFDTAQKLAKEMERRTDAKLIYQKTAVGRLKIVPDPAGY
jgi:ppGpp synthetase/RelA/SpoT-type nucleotidyltranferase